MADRREATRHGSPSRPSSLPVPVGPQIKIVDRRGATIPISRLTLRISSLSPTKPRFGALGVLGRVARRTVFPSQANSLFNPVQRKRFFLGDPEIIDDAEAGQTTSFRIVRLSRQRQDRRGVATAQRFLG